MTAIGGLAEEISGAINGWEPESPGEFNAGLEELKTLYEELGTAVSNMGERISSSFPVEQGVIDRLGELGSHTSGMGDEAAEIHQAHVAALDPSGS